MPMIDKLVKFAAISALSAGLALPALAQTKLPAPLVTGLKNPESVAVGPDRNIYISVIGEFGKDGDGAIMKVVDGKAVPFATGLDDPKGLTASRKWLFTADKDRIWRIDMKGKAEVFGQVWRMGSAIHAEALAAELYRQGVDGVALYESNLTVTLSSLRERLWRFNRPGSLRG